jgi:ribA/ribD-fused uncharacterized protein
MDSTKMENTETNTETTLPSSRGELLAAIAAGYTPKYLFFWGHTPKQQAARKGLSPQDKDALGSWIFSQWYPSPFEVDGQHYPAAEHFMMAEKARLFGDSATREQILAAAHVAEAKALGRKVRPFDEPTWEAQRFAIVVAASLAKYSQNPDLGAYLDHTGDRVLVEAAPRDRIWGIGLGAQNPAARDPARWRGLNLLGFALMVARERLRAREA